MGDVREPSEPHSGSGKEGAEGDGRTNRSSFSVLGLSPLAPGHLQSCEVAGLEEGGVGWAACRTGSHVRVGTQRPRDAVSYTKLPCQAWVSSGQVCEDQGSGASEAVPHSDISVTVSMLTCQAAVAHLWEQPPFSPCLATRLPPGPAGPGVHLPCLAALEGKGLRSPLLAGWEGILSPVMRPVSEARGFLISSKKLKAGVFLDTQGLMVCHS